MGKWGEEKIHNRDKYTTYDIYSLIFLKSNILRTGRYRGFYKGTWISMNSENSRRYISVLLRHPFYSSLSCAYNCVCACAYLCSTSGLRHLHLRIRTPSFSICLPFNLSFERRWSRFPLFLPRSLSSLYINKRHYSRHSNSDKNIFFPFLFSHNNTHTVSIIFQFINKFFKLTRFWSVENFVRSVRHTLLLIKSFISLFRSSKSLLPLCFQTVKRKYLHYFAPGCLLFESINDSTERKSNFRFDLNFNDLESS